MSKNSVNSASTGAQVGSEVKFAGNDSKNKMYEPKHKKKLVRVLTVVAYVFSVSLAAITLSLFYLFIYNPGKPGHNVSSNTSAHGRFYGNHNEGVLTLNNTYSNFEREEPRALPLEVIYHQSRTRREKQSYKDVPKKYVSEGSKPNADDQKTSVLKRIVKTVTTT